MSGFVKEHIIPDPTDEQRIRKAVDKIVSSLPDTFVLSRDNPLDALTEKVNATVAFYKTMTNISVSSAKGKFALSLKQREAIGVQRKLRTELHICNTYINARKKQYDMCHLALVRMITVRSDMINWLDSNTNTLVQKQVDQLANSIESYYNGCTAFDNTIKVMDTSVSAVIDFLNNVLPSWDAQISRSEKINVSITLS